MEPLEIEPEAVSRCASCGAKVKHRYCPKCGEKAIVPERDFHLWKFWKQTMWHLVHFDSKLLRSLGLLFSKPGFLTAEWVDGRRVNYMKPIQLFALAALLFYFFLPTVPVYFCTPDDLVDGYKLDFLLMNSFHFDAQSLLEAKAAATGKAVVTLKSEMAAQASQTSKSLLFTVVPFWGCLIFLFLRTKMPWLVPHFILAMESMTFYLLSDLGLHAILSLFRVGFMAKIVILPLLLFALLLFLALAMRRIYQIPWSAVIWRSFFIWIGFVLVVQVFRQLITIGTMVFYGGLGI